MDRHGPRIVIEGGVCLMVVGLLLSPVVEKPWQLYATLGVLVGSGAKLVSFTAQSLYLPSWFVRHRGLAISIAFSGVGVGAIVLLPSHFEAYRSQKALKRCSHCVRARALNDGVVCYLSKPCDDDALLKCVRAAFEIR
jgi:hypothetical protein